MRRRLDLLLFLSVIALAMGDARAADLPAPPVIAMPPAPARPLLAGAVVYVYSFLDIREQELGAPCLPLINSDLVEALKARGAQAEVLNFRDSPVGQNYASVRRTGFYSDAVPVRETIAENADQERAAGARYRLIVFPSNFRVQGAGQFWEIRWQLVDIAANRVVWSTLTKGDRLVWVRINEGSVVRARGIVEKFVVALQRDGIQ